MENQKSNPDPACLTPGRWREISSIHTSVNQTIRYQQENNNHWHIASKTGDCEDFTLRYRAELLNCGWPSRHLLPALCTTQTGETHMNLLINTRQGLIVLDNRFSAPRPYTQADCTYTALYQPA